MTLKTFILRMCSIALHPLLKEGRLYLFLWYCSAVIPVIFHYQEGITKSIYFFFLSGLVCYIPVLVLSLLNGRWNRIVRVILICTALLNIIIDVTVVETTRHLFYYEHVALILGSNVSEGCEFFSSYFNDRVLLKIFGHLAASLLVYVVISYLYREKVKYFVSAIVSVALLAVMIFTNIMKSESWSEIYLCKVALFADYQTPPDLHEYASIPSVVTRSGSSCPDKIVVIFGESLSKDHMSLYGYSKETNPCLRFLEQRESLFLFQNVESATTGTVSSFENMLSSYSGDDSVDWFRCLTVFDLANSVGYKTTWVSNQSRVGTYDNIVAKYAELADSTIWVGDAMGVYHKGYDEVLVDELKNLIKSLPDHSLVFVHLMGSHEKFADRYPQSSRIFTEDDYSQNPKNQRKNLADYDNSVLYNDGVVSSMFDLFREEDAVCLYFPDHGLDIYESSPDFVGHATADSISRVAAVKIPFMAYVSDVSISENCEFVTRIKGSSTHERKYVTSDVIYTLADLMGIEQINGTDIKDRSIFCTIE